VTLFKRDLLVRAGLVILLLTAILVVFVLQSELPLEYPLFGIALYSLLPLLFVVGAIVFIITLLRH